MPISTLKLVELFCQLDDFCIAFEKNLAPHLLPRPGSARSANRPAISTSQMMCIEIVYHLSGHKCFEYYYRSGILEGNLRSYFPKAPSYNRFVELKPRMLTALVCYLHLHGMGRLLGLILR